MAYHTICWPWYWHHGWWNSRDYGMPSGAKVWPRSQNNLLHLTRVYMVAKLDLYWESPPKIDVVLIEKFINLHAKLNIVYCLIRKAQICNWIELRDTILHILTKPHIYSQRDWIYAPFGTNSQRPPNVVHHLAHIRRGLQKLCSTWHIFAEASYAPWCMEIPYELFNMLPNALGTYSLGSPNVLREACWTFASYDTG